MENAVAVEPVRELTQEEWLAEGVERFGSDPKLWRFVCPSCGHVQTIADFIELRDLKLFEGDPQIAYFSCIGRSDSRIPRNKVAGLGVRKECCDYTLGGLIQLHKTVVVDGEGKKNKVFEFAEAEKTETETKKPAAYQNPFRSEDGS